MQTDMLSHSNFNRSRFNAILGEAIQRAAIGQDHNPAPENSRTIAVAGTAEQRKHWRVQIDKKAERTRVRGEARGGDSPVLRARTRGEALELPLDVLRGGLQPRAPLLQQQQQTEVEQISTRHVNTSERER